MILRPTSQRKVDCRKCWKTLFSCCSLILVNTDHKTHNKIASNSIDFGLKMHYFQNFPGRCPGPRWGAHSAPQTPSCIFYPQTPLNPDPSTLLLVSELQKHWTARLCCFVGHNFLMASMSQKKKKVLRYELALRQKKVPASSNWWHTWQFRKWFGLLFSFESRMQKLNFAADRFDQ